MIKNFKEYISEGMWKSGVERAKSNELRKEDTLNSNIGSLNGVDLGFKFLVADDTLEIDGDRLFDIDRIKKYKEGISKYGWRMMTVEECRLIAYNSRFKIVNGDGATNKREFLNIESKKTKNSVSYDVTGDGGKKFYWVDPDENSSTKALMISIDWAGTNIKAEPSIGRLWHNYEIILVKDK